MAQTSVDLGIVLRLVDRASGGLNQVRRNLDAFESKLESSAKVAKATGEKWEKAFAFTKAAGRNLSLVGGAILGFAGYAVKASMDMEQARVSFTTLLKSGEKAKKFVADLQAFAAATPFEFFDLQKQAKGLLAFGFAARDAIPMLTTLGDAVGALGGGSEMIERVTRAMGQMKAKGKPAMEELLQMGEAGIPVFQILKTELGMSGDQIANIARSGKSADEVIQALLRGMKKLYGGGMAQQSKTGGGMLSNLQDMMFQIRVTIGDVILPMANKAIPRITALLEKFNAFAKTQVGKTFVAIGIGIGGIATVIGPALFFLGQAVISWNALSAAMHRNVAAAKAAGAANLAAGAAAATGGAEAAVGTAITSAAQNPAGAKAGNAIANAFGSARAATATRMAGMDKVGALATMAGRGAGATAGAGAGAGIGVLGLAGIGVGMAAATVYFYRRYRKQMEEEGRALAESLAQGVYKASAPVEAAAAKAQEMADRIGEEEDKFKDAGKKAGDSFADGWKTSIDAAISITKANLAEARLGLSKAETPLEREQALQKTLDARLEQLKASMEGQYQRNRRSFPVPGTKAYREQSREWSETERQVAEVQHQKDLSLRREAQLRAKAAEEQMSGTRIKGKRAAGGPVSAGEPYLVGERGPEVFVPGLSGNVLANSPALAAAMPPVIIEVRLEPGLVARQLPSALQTPSARQTVVSITNMAGQKAIPAAAY